MRLFVICICFAMSLACDGSRGVNDKILSNGAPTTTVTPAAKTAPNGPESIVIDSPDGVKLTGTYSKATEPKSPALLLLHQWQSDHHSYDEFAKVMHDKGFTILAIDGRGFGGSTKKADGTAVSAGRTEADVKAMLGDVDAAFNYLAKQENIDPTRIGIVGASYGSSLALIYAADHPNVAAVALLSPGLNYFGNMPTEPAVKKYGDRRLLLIAAGDDPESADAVAKLDPLEDGRHRKYPEQVFKFGGHGTDLLKVGAIEEMDNFFTAIFDRSNLRLRN